MDNLRAIIFMCLAMTGFALEDFVIKIIAEEAPISQILITIGCLGTVLFSFIALAVKAPIFSADILTPVRIAAHPHYHDKPRSTALLVLALYAKEST